MYSEITDESTRYEIFNGYVDFIYSANARNLSFSLKVTEFSISRTWSYYAAENKFERFQGGLELISRFEFEFRRCGNFFEGFEFLVCSKFNHTQCGHPCACAAACLHPHNSISNVVVPLTIHDNI